MKTTRTAAEIVADLRRIDERQRQMIEELREAVVRDVGAEVVVRPRDNVVFKIGRVDVLPVTRTVVLYGRRKVEHVNYEVWKHFDELIGSPADVRSAPSYFYRHPEDAVE